MMHERSFPRRRRARDAAATLEPACRRPESSRKWVSRVLRSAMLILITANLSAAQETPDTLDWKGYYPLEVGNTWEWRTELIYAYERLDWREIVGDTLIADTTYFVQAGTFWEVDRNLEGSEQARVWSVLLRYDDVLHRVVARTPNGTEHSVTCDLSAAFGSTGDYCDGWAQVVRSDWPEEGFSILGRHVPAAKSFWAWQGFGPTATYYHGIGPVAKIGHGHVGRIYFTYLSLGGIEYGKRLTTAPAAGQKASDDDRVHLYPNPASSGFLLEVPGEFGHLTIDVYDGMGRGVLRTECSAAPCRIDASRLPSGGYIVKISSQAGGTWITRVAIIR